MRKVMNVLDKCCQWVVIVGLAVMTVVLFAQVTARYVFGSGISWSEELARYIMIWVVYIGAAVVYKDNSHISVTVLEEIFNPQARRILAVIQKLVSIGFMGLVGWWSIGMMEFAALQTSPNMLIPMNYIYLVFPISSVLTVLHLSISIYDDLTKPFKPHESGGFHEPSPEAAGEGGNIS